MNSSYLPFQISLQSHLWLPPYPGPTRHLQMALKKGKPRRRMPSSFFLIMSTFLLPPGPDLTHQSTVGWQPPQLGEGRGGVGVSGEAVILWQENSWPNELYVCNHSASGGLPKSAFLVLFKVLLKAETSKQTICKLLIIKRFQTLQK